MKVALYCSAWGKLADEVPEEYPITRAELMEKRMVAELWETTKRPNFIFTHVGQKYKEDLLGGWKETGVPYHGILNAADTFMYTGGTRREEFACDVGFVGGYWPYKARNLDRFILPLCHPSAGLKVKIFGNQPWSVAQYLGMLKDEQTKDLFVSAKVCPNVSEPHSTEFGYDIVERPFKVAAAGGFCISDYVEGMNDIFAEDEMPMFKTPSEFADAIRFYAQSPELRQEIAERAKRKVLTRHTYFHRVTEMFVALGMLEEAERCGKWYRYHVLGKEKPNES